MFAILLSRDNNKEGRSNKLESIANSNVMDTNIPKATVPPKLEIANTENPKNKTMEVYNILTPVSFKAAYTDFLIFHLFAINSCRYFAKK